MPSSSPVLVVGAGPTGLLLAIYLARLGVPVRVIDKASEPGTTSRALVVHARTLELYRQLGLADDVVERSLRFDTANLWVRGKLRGHVHIGALGRGLSPYPHLLIFPQDEHERLLIDRLVSLGVPVERPTELISMQNDGDRVHAVLRRGDGAEERYEASYVAGCDGAHSTVRRSLGVAFPGGTYEHLFYVADVDASGPVANRQLNVILDDADFLAAFPLRAEGHVRLIGAVRDEMAARGDDLGWDDVSTHALNRMKIQVNELNWFSTYHVHHRVAERFQVGRAFLLGDAAHIHSPVGGQGMNTGLGDAANLGWKLADVMHGKADGRLLATYEPERIAFARQLVATTDRAFTFVTKNGWIARRVRLQVVPRVLPRLFKLRATGRLMFRTISQIGINYRGSALSTGRAGQVQGGDRLPWVQPISEGAPDNFMPLESLTWQVHVYGVASDTARTTCRERGLPLHEFRWATHAKRAGLERDACYLIRPDGYIAVALPAGEASQLSLPAVATARQDFGQRVPVDV